MGQYYIAVSLDAKEFAAPFGAKLMEHSWIGNSHMNRIQSLLAPGNSWHKTRIVWAGDYGDKELFTDDPKRNVYDLATDEFKDAMSTPIVDGPDTLYILNHTKNVYIDLSEVPSIEGEERWKIHPLSILTASGNGRGGGDYRDEDDDNVGSWAGDVISSEYEAPDGMEKYTAFFTKD